MLLALFGVLAGASCAGESDGVGDYRLQRLPGKFDQPVKLLPAPKDASRWYVVERSGRVRSFAPDAGSSAAELVLDIHDRIDADGEGGLLGMAFHPRFTDNGELFLSYTAPAEEDSALTSRISRFRSPDRRTVDPRSEEILLSLDQPYSNHNGGNIGFGPDGYLYIGFGDGGSAGDPGNHAQNPDTLLGAMLRIDVDRADLKRGRPYSIPRDNPFAASHACGDAGCPEIFAQGLRNPWRWSFDRETGALWAGDVGQNEIEEIDIVRRGGNYGWRCYEGDRDYQPDGCGPRQDYRFPVAVYDHDQGCSVTGGHVYRGAALPALRGRYLYGDYCSGRVWALDVEDSTTKPELLFTHPGLDLVSFAEDAAGEMYLTSLGGNIYRLVEGKF